jgi:hypothetical protein
VRDSILGTAATVAIGWLAVAVLLSVGWAVLRHAADRQTEWSDRKNMR